MSRDSRGTNPRITSLSSAYKNHGNTNNDTKPSVSNRSKIRVRSIDEIGMPYFPPEVRQQRQFEQQRQHQNQDLYSRYALEENESIETNGKRGQSAPSGSIDHAKPRSRAYGHPYQDLEQPHLRLKSEESIVEHFAEHGGGDAQSRSSNVQNAVELRKKVLATKRVIGRPIPLSYVLQKQRNQNRIYNTQNKESHFDSSFGAGNEEPSRKPSSTSEKKQEPPKLAFLKQTQDDENTTVNNNHISSSLAQKDSATMESKNVPDKFMAEGKQEYSILINNDKDLIDLWECIVANYNKRTANNKRTDTDIQKLHAPSISNEIKRFKKFKAMFTRFKTILGVLFNRNNLFLVMIFVTLLIYNVTIYYMYSGKM